MRTINSRVAILFIVGVLAWSFAVSAQVKPQTSVVPVDLEVPLAPIPVKALGKMNLAYELHLTNFGRENLALTGVEVLTDDAPAAALASYRNEELLRRLSVLNFSSEKQEKNVIGGGQRAVVFLMLSVDPSNMPTALRHRLFFKSIDATDSDGKEEVLEGMRVAVQRVGLPAFASPLRGRWIAANGLSNDTGHRRSIIALGGHAQIAQRFATDWIKLGDDGLVARGGDLSQNANYYGYGAEVLAVADATVVDVKDGIPENVPQTRQRAVPITLETIAGNYVLLDVGGGRFALYAHLQPRSLKVKIGDKVKAGQALGLVGNSGNSDLPHLHIHLVNAASPLGAEGVPYVLKSFAMQGIVKSNEEIARDGFKPDPKAESNRQMEMPVQNAVVVFP